MYSRGSRSLKSNTIGEVTERDVMVLFGQGITRGKLVRKVLSVQHKFKAYKCLRKGKVGGHFQIVPSCHATDLAKRNA